MRIIKAVTNILWYVLVLAVLAYYYSYFKLHELPLIPEYVNWVNQYAPLDLIPHRVGIFLSFCMLFVPPTLVRLGKNTTEQPATQDIPVVFTFVMPLVGSLVAAVWMGIYFWGHDVIKLGRLEFQRGTQADFVQNSLDALITLITWIVLIYTIRRLFLLLITFKTVIKKPYKGDGDS